MKKGISPLIATVLIIGFTIVLAAVIMQWGGSFVRHLTEEQQIKTEAQTKCINLDFEIGTPTLNQTSEGWNWTFSITNSGDIEISHFVVQVLKDNEPIYTLTSDLPGVPGFTTKTYELANQTPQEYSSGENYQLKLIPKIMIDDTEEPCGNAWKTSMSVTPQLQS